MTSNAVEARTAGGFSLEAMLCVTAGRVRIRSYLVSQSASASDVRARRMLERISRGTASYIYSSSDLCMFTKGGRLDLSVLGASLSMSRPDDQPRRSAGHVRQRAILLTRALREDHSHF